VRSCELPAVATQDKVFMRDKFVDSVYAARRRNAFIVAVNCSQAGGTCFCVSMKTGPKAQAGFDLALTEIVEEGQHYFVDAYEAPEQSAVDVRPRIATGYGCTEAPRGILSIGIASTSKA
jgi:sulfhydrogenase subunit beta (sulfur reductase)